MKRFLASLFSFALVLGLMPGIAMADTATAPSDNAQQVVEAGGENPAPSDQGYPWHTGEGGGLVKVSKTITGTDVENYFDITLTVEAKEVIKDTSTAVVIVMDASNTMNSNPGTGTRLANAKQAANQFIEEFCTGEGLSPDRRIGVVTFNTNAQWANGLTLQKVDAGDANTLKSRVNAIVTPSASSHDRFTNMEAGLQLAYNKLKTVDVANKYVIFITDGFPTTYVNRSISGNLDNTTSIKGWDPYETDPWNASKVGTDGYFADAVYKVECDQGTSYSDKAAIRARELAAAMKSSNVNIFSVGIDIGGQTIKGYVDGSSSTLSVVDRTGTKYEIGDADNSQAYAAWLGNSIAGGPKLTAQAHRYAAGNNPQQLAAAFDNILNDIRAVTSLPMTNAYVSDPMGKQVEFLYLYDRSGTSKQKLEGESLLGAENTAEYKAAADAISWDIMNSGLVSISRDEAAGGARTVKYELKYRVRMENESAAYTGGNTTRTNNGAAFNYQSLNPDGSSTHNSPLAFPDPAVKGYKGSFSFKKVDLEGSNKPLQGAVFELTHDNNCTVCVAANNTVAISPLSATSNANGVVAFSNIPSGHDYVLRETSAPIGYQLSSETYPVKVSYGVTTVDGQTWAADDTEVANKHLLPCEVDFVISKSLTYGESNESIEPEHEKFNFSITEVSANKNDETGAITGFRALDGAYTQTITNHGETAEFTPLHFGGEGALSAGTHYFLINETAGRDADIKYDTSFYIAQVTASGTDVDHNQSHYSSEVKIWKFAAGTELAKAAPSDEKVYDSNLSDNTGNEILAFANKMSKPVTVSLPAINKTLDNGTNFSAGQFAFELRDVDDNVIQTITNDENGNASFEPMTFDTAGTHEYTISEVVGDNSSIYYDTQEYAVKITVNAPEKHSGNPYTASVTINGNEAPEAISFSNLRKSGSIALHATKIMDVDQLPAERAFTFDVYAVQKNDQGSITGKDLVFSGVNDGSGLVSFISASGSQEHPEVTYSNGLITFNQAGIYYFHVSERPGDDPTILYDSTVHEITVAVSDRENQPQYSIRVFDDGAEVNLSAAPETAVLFADSIKFNDVIASHVNNGAQGVLFPHFANSTRLASVEIEGTKLFDGKTPAEGAFSFVLKDAEGVEIETVANDAEGKFSFAPLSLSYDTSEGAVNQHVYYVSEKIGDDPTVSYDRSVYRVTVTLEDPVLSDAGLPIPATVKYEQVLENGSYKSADSPVFNNKTKPAIPATGDSPLPWALAAAGTLALLLALVSFRKMRRS